MRDLERLMGSDPESLLRDPERNIQVGCWYLEKFYEHYRDLPEAEPRMVAAYNAGLSRAEEWNNSEGTDKAISGNEFINRINIPSTRAYVSSIMDRYRKLKSTKVKNETPSNAQQ
jgi:soluble lytic murein transglycosylase